MKRAPLLLLLLLAAPAAQADLYRWLDPETGTIKFSSYPPPWYGDPAQERRRPKVERIPAGTPPPPAQGGAPAAAAKPAETSPGGANLPPPPSAKPPTGSPLELMEAQRKALIQDLTTGIARGGPDSIPTARRRIEELRLLLQQLDRADPAGARAREEETRAAAKSIFENLAREADPKSNPQ